MEYLIDVYFTDAENNYRYALGYQSEKTLFVKYPSETAEFLMTAYVFVSNNMSIRYSKKESVNEYLNAFKIMLEQSLNAKKLFSN